MVLSKDLNHWNSYIWILVLSVPSNPINKVKTTY